MFIFNFRLIALFSIWQRAPFNEEWNGQWVNIFADILNDKIIINLGGNGFNEQHQIVLVHFFMEFQQMLTKFDQTLRKKTMAEMVRIVSMKTIDISIKIVIFEILIKLGKS